MHFVFLRCVRHRWLVRLCVHNFRAFFPHLQDSRDEVVKTVEELWDRQEDLQDDIVSAKRAIEKARKRGRPTGEQELKLAQHVTSLSKHLRSPANRRGMAQVRVILRQLPELVLRLPALDPFYGTDAQGVPQRDFASYSGTCGVRVFVWWPFGLGLRAVGY